jgi:teichuronic acid exporter
MINYYLNSHWSGKFIGYSMGQQVKDILPSFGLAASMSLVVYFTGNLLVISDLYKLLIQVLLGAVFAIGVAELIRLDSYLEIKGIILEKALMFLKR